MGAEGAGVLLYLNQEGRGIGLANKMRAYSLQDQGFDTVEANHRLGFEDDERDFRIGRHLARDGVQPRAAADEQPGQGGDAGGERAGGGGAGAAAGRARPRERGLSGDKAAKSGICCEAGRSGRHALGRAIQGAQLSLRHRPGRNLARKIKA
jgi:hypothetical protein